MKTGDKLKLSEFECADCGATINEGEYVTFGVCDNCFQKNYRERMGLPEEKKNTMENKDRDLLKLTEAQDQAAREWNQAFDYRAIRNGVQVGNIKMLHLDEVNRRAMEIYAASGSVAAPKGEMHLRHKLELGREIDSLRQQLEQKTIALDSYYKLAAESAPIKEALTETTEKLMESVSMLDIIRDDMIRDDIPTGGYDPTDWSIMSINDLIQSSQAIIERARKLISR